MPFRVGYVGKHIELLVEITSECGCFPYLLDSLALQPTDCICEICCLEVHLENREEIVRASEKDEPVLFSIELEPFGLEIPRQGKDRSDGGHCCFCLRIVITDTDFFVIEFKHDHAGLHFGVYSHGPRVQNVHFITVSREWKDSKNFAINLKLGWIIDIYQLL